MSCHLDYECVSSSESESEIMKGIQTASKKPLLGDGIKIPFGDYLIVNEKEKPVKTDEFDFKPTPLTSKRVFEDGIEWQSLRRFDYRDKTEEESTCVESEEGKRLEKSLTIVDEMEKPVGETIIVQENEKSLKSKPIDKMDKHSKRPGHKAKLDGAVNAPSKVVHIRSVPAEAVETDIIKLGMPFGKMTNVLLLRQRSQAFLEFLEEGSADRMVQYFQNRVGTINTKPVYIQYSNHQELKTDASHAFQNASAKAALQAANVVMGSDEQPTILRVIIDNALYPVTLDILYQLFTKFGKVLKIITFTKNNTFQALIQMADAFSSATAKTTLDGQNIYNGCDTLRIEFSKLSQLNVKYNNDKSRDYTRDLPSGDLNLDALSLGAPNYGNYGNYGIPGVPVGAMTAMNAMAGFAGYGIPPGALSAARIGLPLTTAIGSSVLLVSNLDEEEVTPDDLFTLFGVYGDVHRVKVLFNKKDNALIQMSDPHQAKLAITYLDKAKVWGKQIRVAQSKHQVVQMPKEGQSDAGLTKDFVNSPLHRFKRPGSKNCQNIFPPSQVLHLSNIPAHVTEESLKTWFSDHGTVKAFKFFPPSVSDDRKDRKMALLQMNTTEEAIHALMAMHNYQMGESCHLRVSFSKSTI